MTDLDDPLLPTAPFLTGPHAADVLRPAVELAGGDLVSAAPHQLVYRPGRDVTVMFGARISWGGLPAVDETLIAASSHRGALPGTVPIEAGDLHVDVWRYPFDPMLPGLASAVTDTSVAALLNTTVERVQLQVVSFRPCRRAVVRVQRSDGDDLYLKVVEPNEIAGLLDRHAALRAVGLPVPEIELVDADAGHVVSRALPGRDLRTVLCEGSAPLPRPTDIAKIVEQFAGANLMTHTPVMPLATSAPRHGAMMRLVMPAASERIDAALAAIASDPIVPARTIVHGDLHDAQLRVDERGTIVGILDVDGAGPGDPLDDLARLCAHVLAVSVVGDGTGGVVARSYVAKYAEKLRHEFRERCADAAQFDRRVAAALIGLATGPFRSQAAGWQELTDRLLEDVARLSRR